MIQNGCHLRIREILELTCPVSVSRTLTAAAGGGWAAPAARATTLATASTAGAVCTTGNQCCGSKCI